MRRMWSLTPLTSRWCQWHCEFQSCIRGFAWIPLWPSKVFIHCLAIGFKFPTACINCSTTNLARWHWEHHPPNMFWLLLYTMLLLRTGKCIRILRIYVHSQTNCHCRNSEVQTKSLWRCLSSLLVIFLLYKFDVLACNVILCILFHHMSPHLLSVYLPSWKMDS